MESGDRVDNLVCGFNKYGLKLKVRTIKNVDDNFNNIYSVIFV